jgi:hypothetical protein
MQDQAAFVNQIKVCDRSTLDASGTAFKGKRTHGGVICRRIHVKQGLGQSHVVENAKLFDTWRCRIISDPIRNGRESGRWTRMMECPYKKMLISIRFDRKRNLACFSTK